MVPTSLLLQISKSKIKFTDVLTCSKMMEVKDKELIGTKRLEWNPFLKISPMAALKPYSS